jgi:hypothetical protein
MRLPCAWRPGTLALLTALGLPLRAQAQETKPSKPLTLVDVLARGQLDLKLKLYDMDRLFEGDQVLVPRTRNKALAAGGWLNYKVGPWHGWTLGLGGAASFPVVADPENDGTGLLAPDQESYSVIHLAFLQLDVGTASFRAYRQLLYTPLITSLDLRMTPLTFEAYTAQGSATPKVAWIASYVTREKNRNSEVFVPMSEQAGWGGNEAVALGGVSWKPGDAVKAQLWDYYCFEMMHAPYAQVDVTVPLGLDWSVVTSLQGLYESSVGKEIGGVIDTGFGAVQVAFIKHGFNGHWSYSKVSRKGQVQYPWSQNPSFTATVEEDQDFAGERAWAWGFSWDFTAVGAPGLVVMWDRTKAYVTDPPLGMSAKEQYESQAIVDYSFQGALKGFKVRLFGAWVESSLSSGSIYGQDYSDLRAIVSYTLSTTPSKLFGK